MRYGQLDANKKRKYKALRLAIINTVACPKCNALIGAPCFDSKGGERWTLHRARRVAAHVRK